MSRRAAFHEILRKCEQAGETEVWIDVMFDDVEREIVGAAKTPDQRGEQERGLEVVVLREEQNERGHADDQKQNGLEVDRGFAFQIAHDLLDTCRGGKFCGSHGLAGDKGGFDEFGGEGRAVSLGDLFGEFLRVRAEARVGLNLSHRVMEPFGGELFDGNFDARAEMFDSRGDAGLIVGDGNADERQTFAECFQRGV